jgi:aspartokinase/homoserine dehydrogenase 1
VDNLLVMKFGGTSMGSADRIRTAAQLAAGLRPSRPVAIVVSAMSKVTDLLLDTLRHAEGGDQAGMEFNFQTLAERHREAARGLLEGPALEDALGGVDGLVAEFRRIAGGIQMLGERPPRSVDEAVAIGERLSSLIIAAHLNAKGVAAEAVNARRR